MTKKQRVQLKKNKNSIIAISTGGMSRPSILSINNYNKDNDSFSASFPSGSPSIWGLCPGALKIDILWAGGPDEVEVRVE